MKYLLILTALFISGCSSYMTPEETVDRNVIASQEGDAETKWNLLSANARKKLLKKNSKDKILERFRKEAWMYKIIQSWNSEILEEDETSVKLKFNYKYQDPHSLSKKVIEATDNIRLVKEDGLWKIDE